MVDQTRGISMGGNENIDHAERVATTRQRRHDRRVVMSLDCSHGVVLDVSAGGVRLVSRKPLEGCVDLVLRGGQRPEVRVSANVVWTKRVRFGEHLTGLEFVEAPRGVLRQLLGESGDDEAEAGDGS